MVLEIVSTLPVTVKYDAVIFVATPNGIQPDRSSSCPVFSGTAGVEKWPVPLTMIALSNFRVIPGREPGLSVGVFFVRLSFGMAVPTCTVSHKHRSA
jgi:hypothetical protein